MLTPEDVTGTPGTSVSRAPSLKRPARPHRLRGGYAGHERRNGAPPCGVARASAPPSSLPVSRKLDILPGWDCAPGEVWRLQGWPARHGVRGPRQGAKARVGE